MCVWTLLCVTPPALIYKTQPLFIEVLHNSALLSPLHTYAAMRVCLNFLAWLISHSTMFFSHNKLANNIFSLAFQQSEQVFLSNWSHCLPSILAHAWVSLSKYQMGASRVEEEKREWNTFLDLWTRASYTLHSWTKRVLLVNMSLWCNGTYNLLLCHLDNLWLEDLCNGCVICSNISWNQTSHCG
jgi:hypothetical protein